MSDSSVRPILIGERSVGAGHPCFVIAEAGVNHNGDVGLAHRLIDVAAESGADAVKFQTFQPGSLVAIGAGAAPYQRDRGAATQRAMLEALVLPEKAWAELASHAAERDLVFLSTAFDSASLDLLIDLGVQALKIPSGELDNVHFIAQTASRGLPVIISTGLGTLEEVAAALRAAAPAAGVALLHCVTAYPAPTDASNLRAMVTMSDAFGVPVGWSDHTEGYVTAVASVTLGASILEKHFTTDRGLAGPDHAASADPEQFAAYVSAVRAVEAALGDGVKQPAAAEAVNREHARRSYHARRDLQPGTVVQPDDVCLLRPATGLPPASPLVGRVITRHVRAGQALTAEDLE